MGNHNAGLGEYYGREACAGSEIPTAKDELRCNAASVMGFLRREVILIAKLAPVVHVSVSQEMRETLIEIYGTEARRLLEMLGTSKPAKNGGPHV